MRLALATLALVAVAAPVHAAPPDPNVECTRIYLYWPEFEESYRSLPPEVHDAVNYACGWD